MRIIKRVNKHRKIYKFQAGGSAPKSEGGLSNQDEAKFRNWYSEWAETRGINPNPDGEGQQYDYRGYWNKNKDFIAEGSVDSGHLPDTWKMPGHPTFSTQSVYSTQETPGGQWNKDGTQFTHSDYNSKHWLKTARCLHYYADN